MEIEVVVANRLGLHARPAALFVQMAKTFRSQITVRKGRQRVNGKSIMGILMLAAGQGSQLVVTAEGPDADRALATLKEFLMRGEVS